MLDVRVRECPRPFAQLFGHRIWRDTTEDGEFTLLPVVCLGNCDNAPTLMINDDLYDRVSPDAVDSILKAVRGHGGDHG